MVKISGNTGETTELKIITNNDENKYEREQKFCMCRGKTILI